MATPTPNRLLLERFTAKRVHFLRDVACTKTTWGEARDLEEASGTVLGNVLGHYGGIEVSRFSDGTTSLSMHTRDEGPQFWRGVPTDALRVETAVEDPR